LNQIFYFIPRQGMFVSCIIQEVTRSLQILTFMIRTCFLMKVQWMAWQNYCQCKLKLTWTISRKIILKSYSKSLVSGKPFFVFSDVHIPMNKEEACRIQLDNLDTAAHSRTVTKLKYNYNLIVLMRIVLNSKASIVPSLAPSVVASRIASRAASRATSRRSSAQPSR